MTLDEYNAKPLHYTDDARSTHVLLRVTDPDSADHAEALFDNLTTPMLVIVGEGLRVWQEFVGVASTDFSGLTDKVELPDSVHTEGEILAGWRTYASGSADEALIIDCYGDPSILRSAEDEGS